MKIKDIVKLTNTYLAGEQLVYQKLVPFYDAVIDEINSRLNSTYPTFSSLELTVLMVILLFMIISLTSMFVLL